MVGSGLRGVLVQSSYVDILIYSYIHIYIYIYERERARKYSKMKSLLPNFLREIVRGKEKRKHIKIDGEKERVRERGVN